jgi:hypothetical protein
MHVRKFHRKSASTLASGIEQLLRMLVWNGAISNI